MGNSKRSPLIFIIMVLAGVVVISLGFVEIQFPEILPFSLVSAQPNVSCVGVDCVWVLAGQSSFDGSPLSETIPLDVFDTSKPIIVNFLITTNSRPSVCISFVDDNGKVDVEINKIDSMGVLTTELIRTINEGSTDISADLQGKEGILVLTLNAGVCTGGTITYNIQNSISSQPFGVITTFNQKPPEIDETSSALLRQKDFLLGSEVTETGQRFAVGESFQLKTVNATVITDFTIQIATLDPDVIVRGVIWDLDFSPPKRVTESVENFTGVQLGNVLGNVKFTFPVVALLADKDVTCVTTPCLPQPISYAVGIRVDRNLDQSFTYLQADGTPTTHGAVIDRTPNINDEIMFVDHGIIGIDINQDLAKGAELFAIFQQEMIEPEPVVCIALFDPVCGTDAITYSNSCFAQGAGVEIAHAGECTILDQMMNMTSEDTTVIICEGISPEPPECQGVDTGSPTAEQCGITEAFIGGACRCVEPFKRAQNGECGVVNEADKPQLLQIGGIVTIETFIIAGAVILGGGVTGLVLRARR